MKYFSIIMLASLVSACEVSVVTKEDIEIAENLCKDSGGLMNITASPGRCDLVKCNSGSYFDRETVCKTKYPDSI